MGARMGNRIMTDPLDTATTLDEAIIAHANATGACPDDHLIIGWTLVGEAVDPARDDGVRTFNLRSETLDPILELGLLTMAQRDIEDRSVAPVGDEP